MPTAGGAWVTGESFGAPRTADDIGICRIPRSIAGLRRFISWMRTAAGRWAAGANPSCTRVRAWYFAPRTGDAAGRRCRHRRCRRSRTCTSSMRGAAGQQATPRRCTVRESIALKTADEAGRRYRASNRRAGWPPLAPPWIRPYWPVPAAAAARQLGKDCEESRLSPPTWQSLRGIQMTGMLGWVVGDGGTVLSTKDGGQSWQLPPGIPASRPCRAIRLAVRGGVCARSAGLPERRGRECLYSGDRGKTWELQSTSQSLPLRDLMFLDAQRGWAVGSLGTILATRDGGATWQRQKGDRTRAAVLAVCSEMQQVPLELLTRLCGDEGYIGVTEIVNHRELEAPVPTEASWEERAHAAVVATGGSVAQTTWRFPLRQPGLGLPLESMLGRLDRRQRTGCNGRCSKNT